MSRTKRVIITITHRTDTIQILAKYLSKQRSSFDEWHIWANTSDNNVLDLLNSLDAKIIRPERSNPKDALHNLHWFYKQDSYDENTDYLKLDDDIVWLEPEFVEKIYNRRQLYNQYFLIAPNIINNAVINHLHMRFGTIPWHDRCWYGYMDAFAWGNPIFAETIHRSFLSDISNNCYQKWYFNKWVLDMREQISINAVCWRNTDMAKIANFIDGGDEYWINNYGPIATDKHSCIVGDILCAHYSFHVQKTHLDTTDILEQYKNLADSV